MDDHAQPTDPRPRGLRLAAPAALVVAIGVYAVFLVLHMGAYAGSSDSSGYLNNARLLADGQIRTPQRTIPGIDVADFSSYLHTPLGFRPSANGTLTPTYPIGLPLAVAAWSKFVGWAMAPQIVMLLSALAGVGLTGALGRIVGLPWAWALFGALILAASPLYTFMSIQFMSDVPATVAATAAVILAWQSRSRSAWWAGLAGFIFAAGVLIRPSNVLLVIPLALCLGGRWSHWLWFGLGGLPGALIQGLYNWRAYGNPLTSGYGSFENLLSTDYVPSSLQNYAQWLPVAFTPVGLLAIGLPFIFRRSPALVATLLAWMAAIFGFYAFYWCTHETWWYLRFVLPAFPACIVGGLWVAHALWNRWQANQRLVPVRSAAIGATLALAVVASGIIWGRRLHATSSGREEAVYFDVVRWEKEHLPANAVVAAMGVSGAMAYYTDFTLLRWDTIKPAEFATIAETCRKLGRPIYAAFLPFELDKKIAGMQALVDNLPGHWTQIGSVSYVTFWKYDPTGPATAK